MFADNVLEHTTNDQHNSGKSALCSGAAIKWNYFDLYFFFNQDPAIFLDALLRDQ